MVAAATQTRPLFGPNDLCIMTGGEILDAEFLFHQIPDEHEFQKGIAIHTRVRCPSPAVLGAEAIDNQLIEWSSYIHKIVRQVELPADIRRIGAATTAFVRPARHGNPHCYTQHIPTLLAQKMRRHAAVHPAAHHHRNLPR